MVLISVFLCNASINILRGVTEDAYGDEIDANRIIASDLPASVTEGPRAQSQGLPADQRGTLVEYFTIRFRPQVDVREGDRLSDSTTNFIYLVTDVIRPQPIVGLADVRVLAKRVGSTSAG